MFMEKVKERLKNNAGARARKLLFGAPLNEQGIEVLERRFECNIPCFQGRKGEFDPLDAMRRDAYREVVLWLRNQLSVYRKESEDNE